MTPITSTSHKNTSFKLSDQVKKILHEKGFSSLFNYSDYSYFKGIAKDAFDKSQAIAQLFISENSLNDSDYSEYIF